MSVYTQDTTGVVDTEISSGDEEMQAGYADVKQAAKDMIESSKLDWVVQVQQDRITPASILERIDKILADTQHIETALETISATRQNSVGHGTIPEGAAAVVEARETTNQKMLDMLMEIYRNSIDKPDGLPNAQPDAMEAKKFDMVVETLTKYLPSEYAATAINNAAQQMFVKPGAEIVK